MTPDPPEKPPPAQLAHLDRELLSQIVESIADPVFVKDEHHRWVHLNQAFCDFVGHSRTDLLGKSDHDFFPAEQADIFWQKDNLVFTSGEINVNVEQLTTKDGRQRVLSTKKSVLTSRCGNKYLVGVIRDITESTHREEHQEQTTRIMQQLVLGASLEKVLQLTLLAAEKEFPDAIASVMLLDSKKRRLYQAVPSRLPDELSQVIDGTPAGKGAGACGEAVHHRQRVIIEDIETHQNWKQVKDVALKYNLRACWSQPVFNFSGTVVGTLDLFFPRKTIPEPFTFEILETFAQLISITLEHQHVERETQHLRTLMSDMINAMPSLLIAVDRSGRVLQWNAEAAKITGISADDARGRELGSVLTLSADQLESIYQAIDDHRSLSWSKIVHRWSSENRWLDLTLYPVSGSSKVGSVIRVDDVTDQVRIEQLLVQTEKIHSLGGLAAGMAHEINNPLAGILQNIQVMKNRLQKGLKKNEQIAVACGGSIELIENYMKERDIINLMEMIIEAGERASGIVNNMLDFCRKGGEQICLNNLPELMDRTVALLDNDYNQAQRYDFRKVEICRDYPPDLPKVPCEGTNLQQVFFNLLKNAAQSIMMADIANPRIYVRMQVAEGWLQIEIEDNGPGMDQETQRRLFEPFYTTKPVGTGTGLGLSVAYFIVVEAHQGRMSVDSQAGQGAKFLVELPLEKNDS